LKCIGYWLKIRGYLSGIIKRPCPLLNYFLLIAKIYLWDCRRNQTLPTIYGFRTKIEVKYETEAYIAQKSKQIGFFTNEMGKLFSVRLLLV